MKKSTFAIVIVVTMIVVGFFIYGIAFALTHRSAPKKPDEEDKRTTVTTTTTKSNPSEGTFELSSTTWQGVVVDARHRIDAKMLTPKLWWQIRPDKDDSKIISHPPNGWRDGKHLEMPKCSIVEYRIHPEKNPMGKGTLVYIMSPVDAPPAFAK